MTTIQLIEHGHNLAQRNQGRVVFDRAWRLLAESGQSVTFDFTGVLSMSTGFAHEVFGKLWVLLGDDFQRRIRLVIPPGLDEMTALIVRGIDAASRHSQRGYESAG